MRNIVPGGLTIFIGVVILLYGAAPVVGLSGVSPGTPCPQTVYFYGLNLKGAVSVAPIGSASLESASQAQVTWNVDPGAWTGLTATYMGNIPPTSSNGTFYVIGTSPASWQAGEVNTWTGDQSTGFISSSLLGEYNTDGSCTNPGGLYVAPPATSTSSSSVSSCIYPTGGSQNPCVTTSAASSTAISTTTSKTIIQTSVTSTTQTITGTSISTTIVTSSSVTNTVLTAVTTTATTTRTTIVSSTETSAIKESGRSGHLTELESGLVVLGIIIVLLGAFVSARKSPLIGS